MRREVARSILWIRFFDDSIDSIDISFHEGYVRDPISLQILFFLDAYPADDYTSVFLIDTHHLRESWRSRIDKFISPQHCEWLISDHTLSREDGTPISIGSLLSNIDKICHFSNFYRFLEEFIFSSHFEIIDEILIRIIEVIFYRSFLWSSDDDDILDPTGDGFLHDILDDGLIHDWEHFFRLSLRCGEEPGTESCGGNDTFSYFLHSVTRENYERIISTFRELQGESR